jgi:hypothetical protein
MGKMLINPERNNKNRSTHFFKTSNYRIISAILLMWLRKLILLCPELFYATNHLVIISHCAELLRWHVLRH